MVVVVFIFVLMVHLAGVILFVVIFDVFVVVVVVGFVLCLDFPFCKCHLGRVVVDVVNLIAISALVQSPLPC